MQTLKYKTMLSIGCFVVLLSGCTFEDDQATLLSHIIGNCIAQNSDLKLFGKAGLIPAERSGEISIPFIALLD